MLARILKLISDVPDAEYHRPEHNSELTNDTDYSETLSIKYILFGLAEYDSYK